MDLIENRRKDGFSLCSMLDVVGGKSWQVFCQSSIFPIWQDLSRRGTGLPGIGSNFYARARTRVEHTWKGVRGPGLVRAARFRLLSHTLPGSD